MKSVLNTVALGAFLTLSSAVLGAGAAGDPVIGSWKLNTAKSTGAQVPKSDVRTYSASADGGIRLSYKRVGADGKEVSVQATYKYDGKDYPVTGAPDFDTLNARHIANNTAQFTLKRKGKPVGTTMRTVSRDGKTLTLTTRRADAKGEMTTTTLVFDRR